MDDILFRAILAVLLAAFILHRGYYTRQAKQSAGAVLEQPSPGRLNRLAGLLAIPVFLSTLVYFLRPAWMTWSALPFHDWLRWLGVGISLAGFALLQWSQGSLGENWSDTPKLMESQEMVFHGPYRWIRHPIYAAFILVLGSTLFISANWFVGFSWILMTVLDVVGRIRTEEALMSGRFGERYQVYMQHTGRLIPRL